jgi:hypothetical protein
VLGDIEVPWWKQVWHKLSWPKCNFFMWLVAHNWCLTWDNLCKCGFQGPSSVFYVIFVKRESPISSSNAPMLGRFGIFGWGCRIWPTGMLPL